MWWSADRPRRSISKSNETANEKFITTLSAAAHDLVASRRADPPLVLLDDVFSELDPVRSALLLEALPAGQTVLSSASGLPSGMDADLVLQVSDGRVDPGPG